MQVRACVCGLQVSLYTHTHMRAAIPGASSASIALRTSMAAEWMRKKSMSLRKFHRLMSRMPPLPPSDCTCALDAPTQELPVWGWVGEGASEGVEMSMCLRVCARGSRRRTREHAPHRHTHPQEVRVEDEVVRDEAEVAGHNRLPGVCLPACA